MLIFILIYIVTFLFLIFLVNSNVSTNGQQTSESAKPYFNSYKGVNKVERAKRSAVSTEILVSLEDNK